MAQLISVKLSRFDGSPWGFRLQGGKDFGTPLIVQKVNGGSPAEAAGLRAGDAVVRVNTTEMYNLRHKDAQDVIMRAGNTFEITVQRGGGSTWKPSVTPVSSNLSSPVSNVSGNITPVTKTSLAAKKQDGALIGSGHNFSPKPFLNGSGDGGPIKSIVNKQYNSPVGIYSEETIAETLSAQAEVLAGGVLGVNFKKNEKNYNAENSEVFKMVQEADKEPKTPEPAEPSAQSGVITPSSPALSGLRPVSAPETRPQQPTTPQSSLPPGQNICAECERLIVGVFVRIKEKNLHVECFKCSTCGTSLKNVGYYNINNKLYCDIHAKLVARQAAPAAGLMPITVAPGAKAPASTISAALANAPMSPPLANHGSSPLPFSACNRTSHDRDDHHGAYHPSRTTLNRNGYVRNGECNGYESKTFTSTITIQTGGTEASTTSNLIGPKPFGAPSANILSTPTTPTLNSGNSTLPRPQSQTVTGLLSALPKPKSSPFKEVYEQSSRYETVRKITSLPDNSASTFTYADPHSNPHSTPHSNPHPNRYSNPYSNSQSDPHLNSDSNPHSDPYLNSDSNPHLNPHLNSYSNPHLNSDANPHLNSHSNHYLNSDSNSHLDSYSNSHSNSYVNSDSSSHLYTHSNSDLYSHLNSHSIPHLNSNSNPHSNFDSNPHSNSHSKPHLNSNSNPHSNFDSNPYSNPHSNSHLNSNSNPHLNSESNPHSNPHSNFHSNPHSNSHLNSHSNHQSDPPSDQDPDPITDQHCHSHSMSHCNPHCNPYRNPSQNTDRNPASESTSEFHSNPEPTPRSSRSSVKAKSLAWPPTKPIEDITYPTASPLYIDPNPKSEGGSRQALRDKRASIEACERVLARKRAESSIEREQYYREEYSREDVMDRVSCQAGGPVYRKVELIESSACQRSRGEASRSSSTDSARRSLTPTRIVQPIPKPWTPGPCTGGKLYEKSYAEPPKVKSVSSSQREVCHRERVCKRERVSEQEPYTEEQTCYRAEVCRMEQTVSKPPLPTISRQSQQESSAECESRSVVERKEEERIEQAPSSQGLPGEHDLITETTEEDVGGVKVKTRSTFEKTVEPMEPEPEETQEVQEASYSRVETVERETTRSGEVTEERTVTSSAETVSSAVDATQMCEQAKREEEEERKRQEEEEERRKQREEEERKKREAEEEERRRRLEEEERNKKHVSFEDDSEEIVEEVIEKPLGRTVVHEERITEEDGGADGRSKRIKETYEEVVEEVLVHERIRRRDVANDQRRKSLREQVEVHQSLRDQERGKVCKYEQPQETMEMSKKHVQFMKQTDTGPRPIPHSALRENATPKEWKSEMVNALTTAPDRPFTPLSTSSSVKELYTEETIYLDHRGRARLQQKEQPRPISPFQRALTIAPERSYTPLSREIGPEDQNICRSETPVCYGAKEGPCPPLDILYGEATFTESHTREQHSLKKVCPRPLPTPPPDFRLRDTSPSPARSRSQTPSKPFNAALKKPDAIPSYQKNLVAMRKGPVEAHQYQPSRTPTPTPARSKSPGGQCRMSYSPSPSPKPIRAQAPRIKEDHQDRTVACQQSSSSHFPTKRSVKYKVEEDTDTGHISSEYVASRTAYLDEKEDAGPGSSDAVHAQFQEQRIMTSDEQSEEKTGHCHTKKSLQVVEDFERCVRRRAAVEAAPVSDEDDWPPRSNGQGHCAIAKNASTTASASLTLPCPMSKPTYTSSTEVRHVRYDDLESGTKSCPETGLTVLPCKAHSDQGTKAGVVLVPCQGQRSKCAQSGVCVVPTSDRSGVCVSPCFGMSPGSCGQPSGCCGQRVDVQLPRNCPESGICVAPCADGSVCVAPCNKQGHDKSRCNSRGASKNLPFPQIPMPFEEFPSEQGPVTLNSCPSSTTATVGENSSRRDHFGPNPAARTNLSGQLARLTAKKDVPTIQLYKQQLKAEENVSRESFRRTTQSHCQTWSQASGEGCCQGQTPSCPPDRTQRIVDPPNFSSHPDLGSGVGGLGGAGSKSGSFAGSSAPKRGRGILNQAGGAGSRVPLCAHCNSYVRGPFITALGQIWCPDHFVCVNTQCRRPLQDIGFVEEKGQLYCEYCFERFIAPSCNKCNNKIKGDCLNAIGKHFHPECFNCAYCGKLFGNSPFFLEEGLPYCEADWNELFTTKCFACGFPVEAGDRWVEALNNNYHSQCFNCTMCKKNLEGQSFYAKGGRPFCKNHAR